MPHVYDFVNAEEGRNVIYYPVMSLLMQYVSRICDNFFLRWYQDLVIKEMSVPGFLISIQTMIYFCFDWCLFRSET
jgi:hypothetical protein